MSVDDIRLFLSAGDIRGFNSADGTLGGVSAIWALDTTTYRDILLDYLNAGGGSGQGIDLLMFMPVSLLAGADATQNFYLFSDMGTYAYANDGPEEWAYNDCIDDRTGAVVAQCYAVPEPGTLALLGLGFAGLGFIRRRRA